MLREPRVNTDMVLKRKKGHFIVTKTQITKLISPKKEWLLTTKQLFNQVVEFYFLVYHNHPNLATVTSKEVFSSIEALTISTNSRKEVLYPIPFDCPCVFRRAAIKKALGMFKSWHTHYLKWQNTCQKLKQKRGDKNRKSKLPKPPVPPKKYNCSPTLYKGMFKEDIGNSLVIKLWSGTSWAWVKHHYQDYQLAKEWIKSTPSLIIKDDKITLNWVHEKYVPSQGKITNQIESKGKIKVCAVDLNLDGDIAVATILECDGKDVRELDRKFLKGYQKHQHRRKSILGKDAVKKSQTNAPKTLDGMNKKLWQKLKNRERYEAERVSRRLADYAKEWEVSAIVFEHLTNLKPSKEKFSRRSNQKRAYWLKSKVYLRTKDKAFNDYGIYTVRVSPKNTSRLFAYDGTPVIRGYQIDKDRFEFSDKGMGALIKHESGIVLNADLNAARNIGLRYLSKYFEKPNLVTDRFTDCAKNRRVTRSVTVCGTTSNLPNQLGIQLSLNLEFSA